MSSIWETVLRFIESEPRGFWAVCAGHLVAWGATQRAKRYLPERLSRSTRHSLTQLIAAFVGATSTIVLWPCRDGAIAALAVGLWAPTSWWVTVRIVGHYWPELRKQLSGDEEGCE